MALSGEDSRLVHQVGKVCPAESGGFLGQALHRDFLCQRLAGGMDLEDGRPALDVGQVEGYPAVEASRPEQSRVQNIRPVGGGQHYDVVVGLEPVHFHQDLVQGLLPLVVASAQASPAVTPYSVDFVDEHYAGGIPLGLVEEVPDPGRAHTDEHFNEFAAADVEEGHARFSGYRPGQQGFSGPGLAHQKHSLGYLGAQGKEPLRVLQELHHFLQFCLGLVHAGNVGEGDCGAVEGHHARPAAPETQGLVIASLGLPHHEQDEAAEEYQGKEVDQQSKEAAESSPALVVNRNPVGRADRDVVFRQEGDHICVCPDTTGEPVGSDPAARLGDDGKFFAVGDNLADLVVLGHRYDGRYGQLVPAADAGQQGIENDYNADDDQQVNEAISQPPIASHSSLLRFLSQRPFPWCRVFSMMIIDE